MKDRDRQKWVEIIRVDGGFSKAVAPSVRVKTVL